MTDDRQSDPEAMRMIRVSVVEELQAQVESLKAEVASVGRQASVSIEEARSANRRLKLRAERAEAASMAMVEWAERFGSDGCGDYEHLSECPVFKAAALNKSENGGDA